MSHSFDDFPFYDPIERHPPERRERKKKYVVLYSCCCCCCCCLHTIGGAVGAVIGGTLAARRRAPEDLKQEQPPVSPYLYGASQGLYWSSFLLTVALGCVVGWFQYGVYYYSTSQNPLLSIGASLQAVGILVILLGPLWFLGASVMMGIRIALRADAAVRAAYWRQLAWITGGILVGSLLGVAIMVPIFFLITR